MDNNNIYSKYRKIGANANDFFNVSYSSELHDNKSVFSDKSGGTISAISLLQLRGRETRKSGNKCRISAELLVSACGSYNMSWNLFDRREKRRVHMRGRM